MTQADAAAPDMLAAAVGDVVERIRRLAADQGRRDLADRLETEFSLEDDASTSIVIAGEAKRGKSSLLNALLGRALSPVDAAVATSSHIVVRYSKAPAVRVFHDGAEDGTSIELAELAEWVTEAGNPLNRKHVRSVEIGVDHPLLAQGLELVDTPGVGGLDAAHTSVTLAALATADALLFVVDASAAMSGPELDFLRLSAERIGTVLFVLTKLDAYPGWRQILEDDRVLLRATPYADAPIFAVSSTLRAAADELAADDPELARELRLESGFDELERELVEATAGRRGRLRVANVLAVASTTVAGLHSAEEAVRDASRADEHAARRAFNEASAHAKQFSSTIRARSAALHNEFVEIGEDVKLELDRALLRLRRSYDDKIAAGRVKLDALPSEIETELHGLAAALSVELSQRVLEAAARVHESFGLPLPERLDLEALGVPAGLIVDQPPPSVARDRRRLRGGILNAGALARMVALFVSGPVGIAVGAVAGVASIAAAVRTEGQIRTREEARALVASAVETIRIELPHLLRERVRGARRVVEAELEREIQRRQAELQAAVQEHQQILRQDLPTRTRRMSAAEAHLSDLDAVRQELAGLRDRLLESAAGESPTVPLGAAQTVKEARTA